jgi:hypothetical protein
MGWNTQSQITIPLLNFPLFSVLGVGDMRICVKVLTPLDGYHQEELEDKIKQLLKEYGVEAKIKSSTGNEMTVQFR